MPAEKGKGDQTSNAKRSLTSYRNPVAEKGFFYWDFRASEGNMAFTLFWVLAPFESLIKALFS